MPRINRVVIAPAALLARVLFGLALVWLMPLDAGASPILDQSQTDLGDGATADCNGLGVCGQYFTVGITGTLTSIDLYLVDATGTPELALYSAFSDAGGTLAQTSTTSLAFSGPGFYSFLFNYDVTAGQTLWFGFPLGNGDGVEFPFSDLTDLYPGGDGFLFIPPSDLPGHYVSFGADAAFRTFVEPAPSVPEPASLTLLGLGLAGMGARRWRQRRA